MIAKHDIKNIPYWYTEHINTILPYHTPVPLPPVPTELTVLDNTAYLTFFNLPHPIPLSDCKGTLERRYDGEVFPDYVHVVANTKEDEAGKEILRELAEGLKTIQETPDISTVDSMFLLDELENKLVTKYNLKAVVLASPDSLPAGLSLSLYIKYLQKLKDAGYGNRMVKETNKRKSLVADTPYYDITLDVIVLKEKKVKKNKGEKNGT